MCVWEGGGGRERGFEGETHLRNTGLNKTQPSSLLKDLTESFIAECSLSVSSGDTVYKPVGIWDSLFCFVLFFCFPFRTSILWNTFWETSS